MNERTNELFVPYWWNVMYIIAMLLLIWKHYAWIFKSHKKAFNDRFTYAMKNALTKSCKHNLKASMDIGYDGENDGEQLWCVWICDVFLWENWNMCIRFTPSHCSDWCPSVTVYVLHTRCLQLYYTHTAPINVNLNFKMPCGQSQALKLLKEHMEK